MLILWNWTLSGVDAKSMLCAFFKQGQCSKGEKCKFSHDLNIGRKGEKRSLYDDFRAEDEKGGFYSSEVSENGFLQKGNKYFECFAKKWC